MASEDEREAVSASDKQNACNLAANTLTAKNLRDEGERISMLDFSDEQNNDADISETDTIPPAHPAANASAAPSAQDAAEATAIDSTAVFTCNDCGKTFTRIGNLRRHERMLHFKSNLTSKATKGRTKRKTRLNAKSDGKFESCMRL